MMMAKMCIICGEPADAGQPVEDTQAIKFIRTLKQKLNMAANNELVVCPAHLEEHKKRRKGFERKLALYVAGGIILLLISIVLPIMSSRPVEIVSVLMIALLAVFLAGLAMLSYVPPLAKGADEKMQEKAAKNEGAQAQKDARGLL
ncbi:MAG: hypothetical protein V1822_04220, partial [Candidatus Micrarchaeota archaeon]